jgi:hypothetical protein
MSLAVGAFALAAVIGFSVVSTNLDDSIADTKLREARNSYLACDRGNSTRAFLREVRATVQGNTATLRDLLGTIANSAAEPATREALRQAEAQLRNLPSVQQDPNCAELLLEGQEVPEQPIFIPRLTD